MKNFILVIAILFACPEVFAQHDTLSKPLILAPQEHEDPTFSQRPKPLNLDSVRTLIGYPLYARAYDIQGKVMVRVLIDHHGIPVRNQIVSHTPEVLDSVVLKHSMALRFTPAWDRGRRVQCWVQIPFDFKLVDDKPE